MSINKVIGLIGWPVSHSLSPAIHSAAFKALGLDSYAYVPMPVAKYPYIRIKEAVLGLRALGCLGANVTVPYKEAVVPYLDQLADSAKHVAAVNTIVVDPEGQLVGHNTDSLGFINDLAEKNISVAPLNVLVLGAGGSARAIIYALLSHNCKNLTILNRTKTKADDLAHYFKAQFPAAIVDTGHLHQDNIKQARKADLIVNTTSIGMAETIGQMPWDESVAFAKNQIVYDLIYNPKQTKLLAHAASCGAKTLNGLGMLVHQGALAFKIWTGQEAPVDIMYETAQKI